MADKCCAPPLNLNSTPKQNAAHRRVLWAVLIINAAMFVVEVAAGLAAGSASLQADALDFLGDAANYGVSLFVVGMALSGHGCARQGRHHGRIRAVGCRNGYLARDPRNAAQRVHDGYGRLRGACS